MKKNILRFLILLFTIIFLFAAYKVYTIQNELNSKQETFNALSSIINDIDDSNSNSNKILNKYQKIYDINKDFIAWIKLDGTLIDYPVMYTPHDPEYYLRRDFEGDYSIPGVPFIGKGSNIDGNNVIVYGHNMDNGTMFAPLLKYKDRNFWENNQIINFDTLYKENEYQVIAAFYSRAYKEDEKDVFRYYEYSDLNNQDEFEEYIKQVEASSIYDTGIKAIYGDKLLTLSTCAYNVEDGRFVVVAKKVK